MLCHKMPCCRIQVLYRSSSLIKLLLWYWRAYLTWAITCMRFGEFSDFFSRNFLFVRRFLEWSLILNWHKLELNQLHHYKAHPTSQRHYHKTTINVSNSVAKQTAYYTIGLIWFLNHTNNWKTPALNVAMLVKIRSWNPWSVVSSSAMHISTVQADFTWYCYNL